MARYVNKANSAKRTQVTKTIYYNENILCHHDYHTRIKSLTSTRHVRDSRFAPHNPKSPMRKIILPMIIKTNAESSIDENGKLVKLNR